jgi:hypothetical protein
MNGLNGDELIFTFSGLISCGNNIFFIGSLRSQNLAAIECGLAGDSLGCSSPRPILYELDLNGNKTF